MQMVGGQFSAEGDFIHVIIQVTKAFFEKSALLKCYVCMYVIKSISTNI